jgi:hypothetical protein
MLVTQDQGLAVSCAERIVRLVDRLIAAGDI